MISLDFGEFNLLGLQKIELTNFQRVNLFYFEKFEHAEFTQLAKKWILKVELAKFLASCQFFQRVHLLG